MSRGRYHQIRKNACVDSQRGVALFTVLIVLLVLAAATIALTQSQRWGVRQTADRLNVLEQTAEATAISTAAHDRCVKKLRMGLEHGASPNLWAGFEGQASFISEDDSRWDADSCIFEWYGLPETAVSWRPRARVTSRVQISSGAVIEVSEWRYPECVKEQQCITMSKNIMRVQPNVAIQIEYGSGQIEMARQRLQD